MLQVIRKSGARANNLDILKINLKRYCRIKLMTIVKEYLDLTEKYKKEYGEKTLVLMQVNEGGCSSVGGAPCCRHPNGHVWKPFC